MDVEAALLESWNNTMSLRGLVIETLDVETTPEAISS
jgi:hypothetical protein